MKASESIRRLWVLSFEIMVGMAVVIIAANAWAAQATLAWDANTESDLAGYRIHHGTASRNYTAHLDVHNVTSYTVTGLADGQAYYFAVTAYNTSGDESAYSNEVSYSSGAQAPVITAGPLAAANPVTLPAATTVSVTASDPNGNSLAYAWSKAAGPGTVTFTNASAASTGVAFSTAGSYTLQVAVSDGTTTVSGNVNVSVLSGSTATSQVASFTLVNSATDKDIRTLADGDAVNLAVTGTNLSIRANVSGAVASVRFALDGNTNYRTESSAPYALAGDNSGDYAAWTPAVGSHTLKATPYSASGGTGTAGTPLTIGFTVTNSAATANKGPVVTAGPLASANQVTLPAATTTVSVTASDPNGDPLTYAWSKTAGPGSAAFTNASAASTAVSFSAAGTYTLQVAVSDGTTTVTGNVNVNVLSASTAANQVTSFTLVNAATDKDIGTLADGDVINLAVTGRSLNIRANVSGSVRSVRFALDGNLKFSTESTAPYALAGDNNSNYTAWTPALGSHSLKATPYSAAGGTGTAGTPLTIGFTVTNSTATSKTLATASNTPTGSGSATLQTASVSSVEQATSTAGSADNSVGTTSGSTGAIDDAPAHYSIAVLRPSNGEWLLDLNGNGRWDGNEADGLYTFGQNGDLPVTGDWNNDGKTDIGVFRPGTGRWLLDLNANRAWDGKTVDGLYTFGQNGDRPVTGDWNNDGKTDIGVFRPNTGRWLLDLNANRAWDGKTVDGLYAFGQNGDLPVTGDWNDDGVTEIGVFRPSTGEWLLDLNGNDKWDGSGVDGLYKFGQNGDLPATGQW